MRLFMLAIGWAAACAPGFAADSFVLFHRHYMEDVPATTVPTPGEKLKALSVAAARGEYEPVTLPVYAKSDLGRVSVSVGPLRSSSTTIRSDAFSVHALVYRSQGRMKLKDYMLDASPSQPVSAGRSARFWITVRVPPETPPGTYDGAVAVTSETGGRQTAPLTLTVHPFRLPDVRSRNFAILYTEVPA